MRVPCRFLSIFLQSWILCTRKIDPKTQGKEAAVHSRQPSMSGQNQPDDGPSRRRRRDPRSSATPVSIHVCQQRRIVVTYFSLPPNFQIATPSATQSTVPATTTVPNCCHLPAYASAHSAAPMLMSRAPRSGIKRSTASAVDVIFAPTCPSGRVLVALRARGGMAKYSRAARCGRQTANRPKAV